MLSARVPMSSRRAARVSIRESLTFRRASHAPREIRTPTVQTDDKALNLARDLPDPSERHRYAHLIRAAGRSGPGGRGVCCHGVVTGASRMAASTLPPFVQVRPDAGLWLAPELPVNPDGKGASAPHAGLAVSCCAGTDGFGLTRSSSRAGDRDRPLVGGRPAARRPDARARGRLFGGNGSPRLCGAA